MGEPVERDSVGQLEDQLTALLSRVAFLQGCHDALLCRLRRVEEAQVKHDERLTELRRCLRSLEARLTEAERFGVAARYG